MQDPDELLILSELQPKKELGQNFLINEDAAQILADSAKLTSDDTVIEIGPGIGSVTKYLLKHAKKVIAIEYDKDVIPYLDERFGENESFVVLNQDVMQIDINDIIDNKQPYKLVGSLPYNISKPIIKKFLEHTHTPTNISVIIQKEVAEDYAGKPPKASFLSNYIRIFGKAEIIATIDKTEFYPEPKVDGAILKIELKNEQLDDKDTRKFASFLKSGFMNQRKKLANNLAGIWHKEKADMQEIFKKLKIGVNARAQELEFEEWEKLFVEGSTVDG